MFKNTSKHFKTSVNPKLLDMKQLLLIVIITAEFFTANAQNNNCLVVPDSLKGTYDGDCNGGKANGFGKAKGSDNYEGNFKNGYPDGHGKYTWKNGNYYTGNWKKGLKDGKGELHLFTNNKDSAVLGFWKKDVYKGEYEESYKIIEVGSAISSKTVQKLDSTKKSVYISIRSGALATASTDNYTILNGSFQRTNQQEMGMTKTIQFQDVQFPFRIRFNGIDRGMIDIEFYETGEWSADFAL
jgi:hypothetical protein